MVTKDIRWKQRFANYLKALSQLEKFIAKEDLNEFEEQGLIQAFEYTYELSWKVIKDYYEYQGETEIQGSRDAFTIALSRGLIGNSDKWMNMIESRQLTSHTYNEEIAEEIAESIFVDYFGLFVELREKIGKILTDEQQASIDKK